MGSSARADIFYGLYLGSEGSWHNDPDWGDLPEVVMDEDALTNAVVALLAPDAPERPTTKYGYDDPEWSAYFDARSEAKDGCPVVIVHGGCNESGVLDYSLAVKASVTHTDWDSNALLLRDQPLMTADDDLLYQWQKTLREWAKRLEIPWDKIELANPKAFGWRIVTSTG
jgi:hypothetical protein